MTALAQERMTDFAGVYPARGTYPIAANVKIFKGSLVVLNSSGQAIPGTNIAGGASIAVGKASATYDNTGGAAAAVDVEVEFGVFAWDSAGAGDQLAADDVGKIVYVVDDQTVGLTDATASRIRAGVMTEFRDSQAYVWMGPHVFALGA